MKFRIMNYITLLLLFIFSCNNNSLENEIESTPITDNFKKTKVDENIEISIPTEWEIIGHEEVLLVVRKQCEDIFCPVITVVKDTFDTPENYVAQSIYSLRTTDQKFNLIDQKILSDGNKNVYFISYSTERENTILINGMYFIIIEKNIYILNCIAMENGNNSFNFNIELFESIAFSLE